MQRLLRGLKDRGDQAVVHGLRGKSSNWKTEEKMERQAVKILSAPVYQGFGPTLAAETIRQGMMREAVAIPASQGPGVRGLADSENWFSGIPASTTGWRDEARRCT